MVLWSCIEALFRVLCFGTLVLPLEALFRVLCFGTLVLPLEALFRVLCFSTLVLHRGFIYLPLALILYTQSLVFCRTAVYSCHGCKFILIWTQHLYVFQIIVATFLLCLVYSVYYIPMLCTRRNKIISSHNN